MLLERSAVLAIRRVAGKNREEVVALPGPPRWQLEIEQLGSWLRSHWKRLGRERGSAR